MEQCQWNVYQNTTTVIPENEVENKSEMAAILSQSLHVLKSDSGRYADPVPFIELRGFQSLLICVQTVDTQIIKSFYIKSSQYIVI